MPLVQEIKRVILAGILAGVALVSTKSYAAENGTVTMERLYNPNSGEHFYTQNKAEQTKLVKLGWHDEGIGWTAPATSATPVYRVYNKNSGDHHYTTSLAEKNNLVKLGWRNEGIGWYSAEADATPIFRAYNANAKAGSHNYTKNSQEQQMLVTKGWRNEGIGWYGLDVDLTGVPQAQTSWYKTIESPAISVANRNNLYPSIMVAQAILESGWGQSELAQNAMNFFGIKADQTWLGAGKPYYTINTQEYVDGTYITVMANFRKYSSVSNGLQGYADKLKTTLNGNSLRYANVFRDQADDYITAAKNLQKDGYATSPTYAEKLITVIKNYRLYVLD
ncbi:glucosaminidase domain-containing protein [Lactococcus insecticola]|uniref:Mannosyl-glycoprotein endo-beta-N-acetylglucosamidase-like domain-containing protein n=1 Tax=Pseudolactococcus insecticola TaxID=2709158 RepID=A0A6A0B7K3_9LACT|nr:glucosaminidase domain-containing protein [Lactococcus insecticola]GFH40458.1 hypothetical protein Hs20B_08560 [Lactococcus insecticola]